MIQHLYTISILHQLREAQVDIPAFHFHNLCARISQCYCCGWNACQVNLAIIYCCKTIHQAQKETVYKDSNPSSDAKKHKQETQTMPERSEDWARQNERVKKFLGQPQNKLPNPN